MSTALHLRLDHLKEKNTDILMLFLNFTLTFATIIAKELVGKLRSLGLKTFQCDWLLDFLSNRTKSA